MKHFLIYTNRHKDKDMAVTRRIRSFLELKGQCVTIWPEELEADTGGRAGLSEDISRHNPMETLWKIPGNADCMIVLGGDGTVLRAARETKKLHIPMIGVNYGTLGYMTEIELSNLEESLDRLIKGDYVRESRMMLKGKICCSDGRTEQGWALNDIVISRSGSLQIIKFSIFVNGQFLNDYLADGMIVTTPTGSTGYNLSAGGPLVEPRARLIVLTPICPHSLNQRSIILSAEDVVDIEIPERGEGGIQTVEASFDASHIVSLVTGDKITIARSEESTEFIRLNQVSFLEVLHKKMQ